MTKIFLNDKEIRTTSFIEHIPLCARHYSELLVFVLSESSEQLCVDRYYCIPFYRWIYGGRENKYNRIGVQTNCLQSPLLYEHRPENNLP